MPTLPKLIGDYDPSSIPNRKAISVRLEDSDLVAFDAIANTLFHGRSAYFLETALVTLGITHGLVGSKKDLSPVPMPSRSRLLTKDATREAIRHLTEYTRQLGRRFIYLTTHRRAAFVRPENVIDLGAVAETFPAESNPRRRVFPLTEVEEGPQKTAWTMRPEHIQLADRLGEILFQKPRGMRRMVWLAAATEYMEKHGLTVESPYPKFSTYPNIGLLSLHLYYDRYIIAVVDAMNTLSRGKLSGLDDEVKELRRVARDVSEVLVMAHPALTAQETKEIVHFDL